MLSEFSSIPKYLYKEFILPSLSPIVVSVVIISTLLFTGGDKSGIILATATVVGALFQLLLQIPKVRAIGYKIKPNFDVVNNVNFHNILELLFPAILSSTVGQIHIYVDMFFASSLNEGVWTSIGYANRVFQFPVGILCLTLYGWLNILMKMDYANDLFERLKNKIRN